ncbi:hypothetical protein ACQ4PT_026652 [Festuca glaucescens]
MDLSVQLLKLSVADGGGEDRLSALPDDVLIHILVLVKDAAAAARTSILASRWPLLPELRFGSIEHHRIGAALAAHEAPDLSLILAHTKDASPESLSAWLPIAARSLSGAIHLEVVRLESETEAGDRGDIDLPCFKKATTIMLELGFLGLALPPYGVFAKLGDLKLVDIQLHGQSSRLGDLLSSQRCPSLRFLLVSDVRGLDSLNIHSDSLLRMKLSYLHHLQQLTVMAPAQKRCCISSKKEEDYPLRRSKGPPASYCQLFQIHELKHELLLAAKANLKHDNIVQLLGVGLEQRGMMLVYEYLPYPSLDTILFDTEQRQQHLDWEKRYSIIRGIARGLLHLHEESGLGINRWEILRPSKVMLDDDMNPKIMHAGIPAPNTEEYHRVVLPINIRRYAAPECLVTGKTTTKSDMFSFGVILLEVVTGRRMYDDWPNEMDSQKGLSYVWDNWKAGSITNIADASLGDSYLQNELRTCLHIGLLCLRKDQKLRPTASAVMHALDTCAASLPTPSTPCLERSIA